MVQKLFPGKYLVGGSRQKIQKLQLLWRHFHGVAHIDYGIIGKVHNQVRVLHVFALLFGGRRSRGRGCLVTAQHCLDAGNQFLGIKGFYHIIISPQLQSQYLVENLSLSGQHYDRYLGGSAQLPADLITVYTGKHQVQQYQVGLEFRKYLKGFLAVPHNHCLITLFHQVEGD